VLKKDFLVSMCVELATWLKEPYNDTFIAFYLYNPIYNAVQDVFYQ